MRARLSAIAFCAALGTGGDAHATYSVVGVDRATGQVGSAGASCVPYEVIRIYRARAGRGAFVAQAYFDDAAVAHAETRLAEGASPATILAEIVDETTYPDAPRMQYGIVDVGGRAVTYTGPLALPTATDRVVDGGDFVFALQGNVLTSRAVLDRMAEGLEAPACDLAERLLRGLEAASADGEGDNRCTPDGVPAKSAYLDVTDADTVVRLSLPDVSPTNPIVALRGEFDAWRASHPCPVPGTTSAATSASGDPDDGPPTAASTGCVVAPGRCLHGGGVGAILLLAAGFRRARKKSRG